MQIRFLGDVPSAVPLLAEWFYAEWHDFDGRSRSEIEVLLRHNLSRDALPVTFVALDNAEVIGTVSLDTSDLPPYDHLSPWLASLYVVPSRRREGIGRALVEHLVAFALERGISPLYLWTPGSTHVYEEWGWQILCCDVYSGRPIPLMWRALEL
jgi:GNAT superfamily N-acetyltransferase